MFYLYHFKCTTCGQNSPVVITRNIAAKLGANLDVRDVRVLAHWRHEYEKIGGSLPFIYDYQNNVFLNLEKVDDEDNPQSMVMIEEKEIENFIKSNL